MKSFFLRSHDRQPGPSRSTAKDPYSVWEPPSKPESDRPRHNPATTQPDYVPSSEIYSRKQGERRSGSRAPTFRETRHRMNGRETPMDRYVSGPESDRPLHISSRHTPRTQPDKDVREFERTQSHYPTIVNAEAASHFPPTTSTLPIRLGTTEKYSSDDRPSDYRKVRLRGEQTPLHIPTQVPELWQYHQALSTEPGARETDRTYKYRDEGKGVLRSTDRDLYGTREATKAQGRGNEKERENERGMLAGELRGADWDRQLEKERVRERPKEAEVHWEKDREKDLGRGKDRERYREREKEKDRLRRKEQERERNKEDERAREREKERERREREKERERGRERENEREKEREREREREKDRQGERYKAKVSEMERTRLKERDSDRERGRNKDKDKDRTRDRGGDRDGDTQRDRDRPDILERERERDIIIRGREDREDTARDKEKARYLDRDRDKGEKQTRRNVERKEEAQLHNKLEGFDRRKNVTIPAQWSDRDKLRSFTNVASAVDKDRDKATTRDTYVEKDRRRDPDNEVRTPQDHAVNQGYAARLLPEEVADYRDDVLPKQPPPTQNTYKQYRNNELLHSLVPPLHNESIKDNNLTVSIPPVPSTNPPTHVATGAHDYHEPHTPYITRNVPVSYPRDSKYQRTYDDKPGNQVSVTPFPSNMNSDTEAMTRRENARTLAFSGETVTEGNLNISAKKMKDSSGNASLQTPHPNIPHNFERQRKISLPSQPSHPASQRPSHVGVSSSQGIYQDVNTKPPTHQIPSLSSRHRPDQHKEPIAPDPTHELPQDQKFQPKPPSPLNNQERVLDATHRLVMIPGSTKPNTNPETQETTNSPHYRTNSQHQEISNTNETLPHQTRFPERLAIVESAPGDLVYSETRLPELRTLKSPDNLLVSSINSAEPHHLRHSERQEYPTQKTHRESRQFWISRDPDIKARTSKDGTYYPTRNTDVGTPQDEEIIQHTATKVPVIQSLPPLQRDNNGKSERLRVESSEHPRGVVDTQADIARTPILRHTIKSFFPSDDKKGVEIFPSTDIPENIIIKSPGPQVRSTILHELRPSVAARNPDMQNIPLEDSHPPYSKHSLTPLETKFQPKRSDESSVKPIPHPNQNDPRSAVAAVNDSRDSLPGNVEGHMHKPDMPMSPNFSTQRPPVVTTTKKDLEMPYGLPTLASITTTTAPKHLPYVHQPEMPEHTLTEQRNEARKPQGFEGQLENSVKNSGVSQTGNFACSVAFGNAQRSIDKQDSTEVPSNNSKNKLVAVDLPGLSTTQTEPKRSGRDIPVVGNQQLDAAQGGITATPGRSDVKPKATGSIYYSMSNPKNASSDPQSMKDNPEYVKPVSETPTASQKLPITEVDEADGRAPVNPTRSKLLNVHIDNSVVADRSNNINTQQDLPKMIPNHYDALKSSTSAGHAHTNRFQHGSHVYQERQRTNSNSKESTVNISVQNKPFPAHGPTIHQTAPIPKKSATYPVPSTVTSVREHRIESDVPESQQPASVSRPAINHPKLLEILSSPVITKPTILFSKPLQIDNLTSGIPDSQIDGTKYTPAIQSSPSTSTPKLHSTPQSRQAPVFLDRDSPNAQRREYFDTRNSPSRRQTYDVSPKDSFTPTSAKKDTGTPPGNVPKQVNPPTMTTNSTSVLVSEIISHPSRPNDTAAHSTGYPASHYATYPGRPSPSAPRMDPGTDPREPVQYTNSRQRETDSGGSALRSHTHQRSNTERLTIDHISGNTSQKTKAVNSSQKRDLAETTNHSPPTQKSGPKHSSRHYHSTSLPPTLSSTNPYIHTVSTKVEAVTSHGHPITQPQPIPSQTMTDVQPLDPSHRLDSMRRNDSDDSIVMARQTHPPPSMNPPSHVSVNSTTPSASSQEQRKKGGIFDIFKPKVSQTIVTSQYEIWKPPTVPTVTDDRDSRNKSEPTATTTSIVKPDHVSSRANAPPPISVPIPISVQPVQKSPNSKVFTPFRYLTSKRHRTMSAASVEAQDGTAANTVVGSPTASLHSQAPIAPPPLRDPQLATKEWRNREEAEVYARSKGKQRRRRPGVVFDVAEDPTEEQKRSRPARTSKARSSSKHKDGIPVDR